MDPDMTADRSLTGGFLPDAGDHRCSRQPLTRDRQVSRPLTRHTSTTVPSSCRHRCEVVRHAAGRLPAAKALIVDSDGHVLIGQHDRIRQQVQEFLGAPATHADQGAR